METSRRDVSRGGASLGDVSPTVEESVLRSGPRIPRLPMRFRLRRASRRSHGSLQQPGVAVSQETRCALRAQGCASPLPGGDAAARDGARRDVSRGGHPPGDLLLDGRRVRSSHRASRIPTRCPDVFPATPCVASLAMVRCSRRVSPDRSSALVRLTSDQERPRSR